LNQLVDFYEIQHGGHAIEGNLEQTFFLPVASAVPKMADVQTSDVDAEHTPLNVVPRNFAC
jgi:hypothetical protein